MDRIDNELGYTVWHPDGTVNYEGIFEGSARDFVDWVQDMHRKLDEHVTTVNGRCATRPRHDHVSW